VKEVGRAKIFLRVSNLISAPKISNVAATRMLAFGLVEFRHAVILKSFYTWLITA